MDGLLYFVFGEVVLVGFAHHGLLDSVLGTRSRCVGVGLLLAADGLEDETGERDDDALLVGPTVAFDGLARTELVLPVLLSEVALREMEGGDGLLEAANRVRFAEPRWVLAGGSVDDDIDDVQLGECGRRRLVARLDRRVVDGSTEIGEEAVYLTSTSSVFEVDELLVDGVVDVGEPIGDELADVGALERANLRRLGRTASSHIPSTLIEEYKRLLARLA